MNPFKFINSFEYLNSNFCNVYLLFFLSRIRDCMFGMYVIFQVCSFFQISVLMELFGCRPIKFVSFQMLCCAEHNVWTTVAIRPETFFWDSWIVCFICLSMKASGTSLQCIYCSLIYAYLHDESRLREGCSWRYCSMREQLFTLSYRGSLFGVVMRGMLCTFHGCSVTFWSQIT